MNSLWQLLRNAEMGGFGGQACTLLRPPSSSYRKRVNRQTSAF